MSNVSSEPLQCTLCGITFIRASNRQKYCTECKRSVDRENCKGYYSRTYKKKGYNQARENNNAWKGGIGWYPKLKLEIGKCQECSSVENLLVHHIDTDRSNNDPSNLKVLCRRCHHRLHITRDSKGRFSGHL